MLVFMLIALTAVICAALVVVWIAQELRGGPEPIMVTVAQGFLQVALRAAVAAPADFTVAMPPVAVSRTPLPALPAPHFLLDVEAH